MAIRSANEYEKLIYTYLTNQGKYDHFSFSDTLYNGNLDVVFKTMLDEKNPATPTECCAYLFGKAAEATILTKCRPGFKRIWVSPEEVTGNIKLNLPAHLEAIVIDMLEGCENAVEKYLEEENADVKDTMLQVQYIAEKICNDDQIYNEELEGISNNDVAFPIEAYVFANNAILKQLTEEGYSVIGVTDNPNSPVSCILKSPEGEKMIILEDVTIAPKTARFPGYLKEALAKLADKEEGKPYLLGIMLEAENEKELANGIITKSGKTVIKRTDFMPLN